MIPDPVAYTRPEVVTWQSVWARLQAVIDGEDAVKALGDKILPRPNPGDTSEQNKARYDAYLRRASFYNVTGRTVDGMIGYVFGSEPVVKLPDTLARLKEDADGSGITLVQQCKETLSYVLAFGRAGLLVDFPATNGPVTVADVQSGSIAPTILLYHPSSIINWNVERVGNRTRLTLLVLKESFSSRGEDGFTMVPAKRYRVFVLTSEGVKVSIYERKDDGSDNGTGPVETHNPTDKRGSPLMDIPFTFIGSVNNHADIDTPPILDLANVNLAHFRNSADFEESCFVTGQPTIAISGLTEDWVTTVLKGRVEFGSRAAILLPTGGSANLLQADPNNLPKEAMVHKEQQMVALGARLVEAKVGGNPRTATEVGFDKASEVSTLTACTHNVLLAYKQALAFCGVYVGSGEVEMSLTLAEPLTHDAFEPNEAAALMTLWNGGLLTFTEVRGRTKRLGLSDEANDEVLEADATALKKATNTLATTPKPAPAPAKSGATK